MLHHPLSLSSPSSYPTSNRRRAATTSTTTSNSNSIATASTSTSPPHSNPIHSLSHPLLNSSSSSYRLTPSPPQTVRHSTLTTTRPSLLVPSSSVWSLNPPPTNFGPGTEVVRHTTKLLKSRDSRTGRLIINQYMKGKEIGRGVHGIVYIGKNMDKVVKSQSSADPELRSDEDYETVAIKVVRREPRGPKSLRRSQMERQRQRDAIAGSPPAATSSLRDVDDKLKKEIAIMKRLRHRHIVQLMEVIDDAKSKKVFMILEFMEGGQVKWQDELEQTPLMTVEQARRTFRQVLLGLEYLHYQGIIHRDIKPANLLWTADRETVKISDFGVSHLSGALKRSSSSANLSSLLPTSATGVVAPMSNSSMDDQALRKTEGSPAFMAPELCCPLEATPSVTPAEYRPSDYFTTRLSQSPIDMNDERVISHPLPPHTFPPGERPGVGKGIDIWALGVTLFCLLFGQTPFKAPNEYELFNVIWYEAVAVPEAMGIERATTEDAAGRQLVDLLGRLLRKDPRQRIRLEDVKTHAWTLTNLDNTQEWVDSTAPVGGDEVVVTKEEVANFSHPRRNPGPVEKGPLGGVRMSLRKAAARLGLGGGSSCTSPIDGQPQTPSALLAELSLAPFPSTAEGTWSRPASPIAGGRFKRAFMLRPSTNGRATPDDTLTTSVSAASSPLVEQELSLESSCLCSTSHPHMLSRPVSMGPGAIPAASHRRSLPSTPPPALSAGLINRSSRTSLRRDEGGIGSRPRLRDRLLLSVRKRFGHPRASSVTGTGRETGLESELHSEPPTSTVMEQETESEDDSTSDEEDEDEGQEPGLIHDGVGWRLNLESGSGSDDDRRDEGGMALQFEIGPGRRGRARGWSRSEGG